MTGTEAVAGWSAQGTGAVELVLGGLAVVSFGLMLWQWAAGRSFARPSSNPFGGAPVTAVPVTVLKPLKGCDAETESCLRSWLEQDYPGRVQILFGVASGTDPVCPLVRRLLASASKVDGHLEVCGHRLGLNAKVSTLAQLERLAQHEILVVSDADVRVPPGFLSQLVPALNREGAGLASCFYGFSTATNFAMRWEALAVNADFWSQVLQSCQLSKMDFALGAAMGMRRSVLQLAGGFGGLVDCLADDFELGRRVARGGARVELVPLVVECRSAPQTFAEVWAHQGRWARTIRACRPVAYFLSILGNATVWPVAFVLASWLGGAGGWLLGVSGGGAALCLAVRAAMARDLQLRLAAGRWPVSPAWMAWLKDLFGAVLWARAFVGNRVEWRDETFVVGKNGSLKRLA